MKVKNVKQLFLITTCFGIALIIPSCKEKQVQFNDKNLVENLDPKIQPEILTSDTKKWWTYHVNNITLSSAFEGLDENSEPINKLNFLEKLITSDYIPLKLKSANHTLIYKLFKLETVGATDIRSIIKNVSKIELKHYKMGGKKMPDFNFITISGDSFSTQNTKGKTLILKTWFINCKACIEEFPELNEFVEKHKKSDDFIFLSLALDSKENLENFLKKRHFEYKVVPKQEEFIDKNFNLTGYPTHIVVDRAGTILKVVNKASEMIEFVEESVINNPHKGLPPPPPPMN
jgi:peroxiredoxin